MGAQVEEEKPAEATPSAVVPEAPQNKGLDAVVVTNTVSDVLAELIGDEVETDAPFMDAGLDSLLSIQFRTAVSKAFTGLKLPSTLTFDYPTTKELTNFIVEMSLE